MTDVFIVRLEPELPGWRKNPLMLNIANIPGVVGVADAAVVSRTTLDEWLLPEAESLVKPKAKRKSKAAA